MSDDRATVLIVDDERDLADLYSAWLADEYDVVTTYGGQEAIDAMDDSIDVALVDRLMPEVPGSDVVAYIREEEFDCAISMVTAVEPDFDILEMGFDEYIVKPIREKNLVELVEALLARSTYDDQLQEMFSLASKVAALKTQKPDAELEHHEEFQAMTDRLDELRGEIDRTAADLSERDFEVELRQLNVDS